MGSKRWPPPGFPLVQGDYALTAEWEIYLREQFARRVEDDSLVLWRPGLTLWMVAWGNDREEPQAERLARIKADASPDRFAERESVSDGVTRFSYRLRDENDDGAVESLNAFVLNDDGHLQMSAYFDEPADEFAARDLVDGVRVRRGDDGAAGTHV